MSLSSKIIVIPQYIDICWFNSILMSCFYSQQMRKLMIGKISKLWDNSSLFKLFKTILKYNYDKTGKITLLFNKIRPELILLKVLTKYDNELLYNMKEYNQEFNLKWENEYIRNFLKFCKVNYLDITYLTREKKILFNFLKHFKPYIDDEEDILKTDIKLTAIDIEKERNEIKTIIDNIPDVLILTHTELNKAYNYNNIYTKLLKTNRNYHIYDASNFEINEKSKEHIINYADEIILFDNIYKLDSVLISNYNKDIINSGHSIVGLHYKNNRYVYNGFNRTIENTPCPLIKFNWNLRIDTSFCLDTDKCELPYPDDEDEVINECFSFNKGNRILVYVKIPKIKTSSIITSKSTSNLSNISNIIEDYFNLDNLNIDKIKEILEFLKISEDSYNEINTDFDKLKDLLFKKLLDYYGYTKKTKKELITYIKEFDPDITGLNSKRKTDLQIELIEKKLKT